MHKLREALEEAAQQIGLTKPLLAKARRRSKRFRERAEDNRARQVAAQKRADANRVNGDVARANRQDRIAARCDHRAARSEAKRNYWLGRIKVHLQRLHDLKLELAEAEAALAKWKKEHGVVVRLNTVTGGTARQRLRAAMHTAMHNCATGKQNNYYSMIGLARAYAKTLRGYPFGHIWDCSTFADGLYFVCGLKSPSGITGFTIGGYTGTEMSHGKVVSEADAQTGDLVIYLRYPGDTIGHHVEVVDDPDARTTVGHGSAPIDRGTFDLFGDGLYVIRSYV